MENGREIPGIAYNYREGNLLPELMPTPVKEIPLKHNGQEFIILELYAGFDIETTNIPGEAHEAYMYHWQFAIANDNYITVFTGRTWNAFLGFMEAIEDHYNLSSDRRLIIWVANLGFEFQFMRKYFDWDVEDFFAREERHPFKCRAYGFEFHEALTISGGTLEQLAKDYTATQKLKGDLDYSILRNSQTQLTYQELSYCLNDVIILSEWSRYIFVNYIIPDKRVPLTKTGILRSETRQNGVKMLKSAGFMEYRKLIYDIFPDEKTYQKFFKYLFRGGYVHANINLCGYEIDDMEGHDITSSYPTEMLLKDNYPITKFIPVDYDAALLHIKCCIMRVTFTNIRRRYSISIESKSKAEELENSATMPIVIDNGRIAQAGKLTVWLTELDFENYKDFYIWDKMEVSEFYIADRGKLPLFIRATLAKYYILKSKLKASGLNNTPEYVIAKQKVNSFFGMMVTRIELDKISYDNTSDNWVISEKELDYQEEIKSQFLAPQWGIWVTANARRTLLYVTARITDAIGDGSGDILAGVAYNDTDSIKIKDPTGAGRKVIEKYNEYIRNLRRKNKMCNKPEFDGLGEFEFEGHYNRFKTLGAKRYLVEEDGEVKATIAGLPKQSILKLDDDPFDAFNYDGMELSADVEIKKTIAYHDEPTSRIVEGELMHEESSAGIYDIGFTLSLDKAYYLMIVSAAEEGVRKYGD